MRRSVVFILIACISFRSKAQHYFQQEVNYKIDVKLDDIKHELSASEEIEYVNNSSTALNFIYFHLWPNAYKNSNTAFARQLVENGNTLFYYSKEEDKGSVDQLNFKVDGQSVIFLTDSQTVDIGKILLNSPLQPGGRIKISTPFHVKIPNGMFSRIGHEAQQYQITQWYPKPAVFDKYGWHPLTYLDQGEFYSEFGSFDVRITVPENYVVGATGDLQDEGEKQWINERAMKSRQMEDYPETDSFPASSPQTKTLHYKQNNIHDFAWFCDKRYNVLKSEVELPHSHRKVTTWVLFNNSQARLWRDAVSYVNDALYYYSLWNGDYPYDNCTAVDGALSAGGGMEYPNITVISSTPDAFSLDDVITHEVGHNWFYGILGSNERRHAWMDEGINTFYEKRYMRTKYPGTYSERKTGNKSGRSGYDFNKALHKSESYLEYMVSASKNEDQPCDYPAEKYTKANYAADVYLKTGLAFDYLQAYLGEDKLDSAMKRYFETWKYKHPQPEDLRRILEETSGKNLSWFFDDLLETTKKIDYKIKSFRKLENGNFEITVKNKGGVKGPLSVAGIRSDSVIEQVWYEGFAGKQHLVFPAGRYDKFKIDCKQKIPEINRNNNTIYTKGVLKKTEPLRLQFLFSPDYPGLDNPDKTQIYFCPTVGWNNYNKFMLGAAFYNLTVPDKHFEYMLDPMYGFGNNDIAGYGNAFFNFFPAGIFQKIAVGANVARFAYSTSPFSQNFNKLAPEIDFTFNKREARSSLKNTLKLRSVSIVNDTYSEEIGFQGQLPVSIGYSRSQQGYTINEALFTSENSRVINPCRLVLDLQQMQGFVKTSLEGKYEITFKGKRKSFDIRFFAGKVVSNSLSATNPELSLLTFKTSGWTGSEDYLYDNIFLGRSETSGLLSQQFVENDGDFKIPVFLGQTAKWLTALNFKSSIPGILPLRLYADFAVTDPGSRFTNTLLYEAGVDLCIAKDILEIYFPIPQLLCSDFRTELSTNNIRYAEQIRFTLNLNLLNPFNFIKNYKF